MATLWQTRLLLSPYTRYSDDTVSELAILRAAKDIRKRYGVRAVRNTIISHTETVPTCSNYFCCKRKSGCCAPPPANSMRW